MSTHPNTPRLLKGGIVLLNRDHTAIEQIITLQYNPAMISRSLTAAGAQSGGEGGKSDVLRLSGPPTETYTVKAEIDATDDLESGNRLAAAMGIQPILNALETIIYPRSRQLFDNNALAQSGTLEILPMEAPLTLFIWNRYRIVPVRFTSFSIEEQEFDTRLNPIRAEISLSMQVLNIDDFGFDHRGGTLYMNYQQNKESLAKEYKLGELTDLGIRPNLL